MLQIDPHDPRQWIKAALRTAGIQIDSLQGEILETHFMALMTEIDRLHEIAFPTF